MTAITRKLAALGVALLLAPVAASTNAKDREKTPAEAPAVFREAVDCKAIADATARLACYDRTVAALEAARSARDLVIIDRATMRETRQGLFGISLPKLKLFGGDGDDDDADMVREITSTIKAIGTANDGLPIYLLAEGGKWKQTDGRNVFPKVGHPITIRLGTLNKYTASINGRSGVRVIRLLN